MRDMTDRLEYICTQVAEELNVHKVKWALGDDWFFVLEHEPVRKHHAYHLLQEVHGLMPATAESEALVPRVNGGHKQVC